jgi:hypothetical protein
LPGLGSESGIFWFRLFSHYITGKRLAWLGGFHRYSLTLSPVTKLRNSNPKFVQRCDRLFHVFSTQSGVFFCCQLCRLKVTTRWLEQSGVFVRDITGHHTLFTYWIVKMSPLEA